MGTIARRTTRESMEVAITCDYQHTYMCCYDYHYQHVHNNVLQSGCYLLFLDVAKHALLLSTAHTHKYKRSHNYREAHEIYIYY